VPNPPIHLNRVTLAVHLILTGYGHWLPNDLRGSGSSEVLKDELKDMGDIHHGRKRDQPSRDELKNFHREAEPLLDHEVLWFDKAMRNAIGKSFGAVIKARGYTCWACAVLRDHAHLLIRNHRDKSDVMWSAFAEESQRVLRPFSTIPQGHPIWSSRPYKVLLFSRAETVARVPYIEGNPRKHRLPDQHWEFVTRCPWI
jgi:REP element-mobilizing transposase RayT